MMNSSWKPAPGVLVRYDSGSTALALCLSPHSGGWHGTQCMGGTTFFHDNGWSRRLTEPTPEDREKWVDCAVRYRKITREKAEVEAGLREASAGPVFAHDAALLESSPEVAGENGVVGCPAALQGGFAQSRDCPRGCMNDAHACKARRERREQGLPAGPVFRHDEALLDSLCDELSGPGTGFDTAGARGAVKDIAKTYCMQMLRKGFRA